MNPTLKQSEMAKELGCSSSTLKRYRNYKNMISPFRSPSNTNKRKQKFLNTKHEPKRPQMSSNDPTVNSVTETVEPYKPVKKKKLKGGGNIEINDKVLDENLHIRDL